MLDLTFMCCIYSSGTTPIRGPLILEGPTNNSLMCNSLIHMHLNCMHTFVWKTTYIHSLVSGHVTESQNMYAIKGEKFNESRYPII